MESNGDYVKEIQASHKLGYPAYRISSECSPTLIFTYENTAYCLRVCCGVVDWLTSLAVTKNALPRILEGRAGIYSLVSIVEQHG